MSSVAMIGIPEELLYQTAATTVENNTKTKQTKSYKLRSSNGGGGVLQEIQPQQIASSTQMMTKDRRSCTTSSLYTSSYLDRTQNDINRLVIIEGNIGVGKTTLAQTLSKTLHYKLFVEPAEENPYLEKFYADPKKYALSLQLWILQQRYTTYLEAVKHILTNGGGAILDRSVYSDVVFANVCTKEGYITSEGYSKYQFWRQKVLTNLPSPHITVYLDATPKCCHTRIHKRGRECEGGVPLDYLSKLHEEYILFLRDMKELGSHIIHYDWSTFQSEDKVSSDILQAKVSEWSSHSLKKFIQRASSTELFQSLEELEN